MPAIRPTDDEWMDLEDFAKLIGKSLGTLYNERSRGADFPPTYNLSRRCVRLRRSDVDAWLSKFRHESPSARLKKQSE